MIYRIRFSAQLWSLKELQLRKRRWKSGRSWTTCSKMRWYCNWLVYQIYNFMRSCKLRHSVIFFQLEPLVVSDAQSYKGVLWVDDEKHLNGLIFDVLAKMESDASAESKWCKRYFFSHDSNMHPFNQLLKNALISGCNTHVTIFSL